MKNSLLAILVFCSFSLFAQNYSISGKVLDNEDNKPLPGAHISLNHPWGEAYKTAASDNEGNFKLKGISKGGYHLKISFIGYEDFQKEITYKLLKKFWVKRHKHLVNFLKTLTDYAYIENEEYADPIR